MNVPSAGSTDLLILGASTRAAAFSALRAGLHPFCGDLFADRDLEARCPVAAVPGKCYPEGLMDVARQAPPGPWIYTGGLENRPEIVERISLSRDLWGNPPEVLRRARDPYRVAACLQRAGLPVPALSASPEGIVSDGSWLAKPYRSAGGSKIHAWRGRALPSTTDYYFQQRVSGPACAAIYVADGKRASLIGFSEQLVGQRFLHARPFAYCGSIAPLGMGPETTAAFMRVGECLAEEFGLLGLFGVDAILHEGLPWIVEINPRYTASVELIEYASGIQLMALHRAVFVQAGPCLSPTKPPHSGVVGKAILFAPQTLEVPDLQNWMKLPADLHGMPQVADIPQQGSRIRRGRPILTVFCRAGGREECLEGLQTRCSELWSALKRSAT